ncbi:MAG: Formate hydrogenlyase subunit 7 [Candidatus Omnitrophica bacterium ADurb.Bin292]|jgi:Ni,Fe-hydrogenase III small subunit/formate hydrogenlyase subunit 6/NADH:ubiquinone oxidoreductase subunit I|nr:MAG: Formate hydrogenlyase subunit 7 [Candidatus Omnitrophica bacterium ADurb.Bin292]HPW77051.1 NADH-quinone oxidoreductase subunit NuoB [Candidatus Omnitrophota bacterium]HQB11605.1 NADH-quinone oxidoreductase subunit NuoB [Candidatus Omnitrophota bacterium]
MFRILRKNIKTKVVRPTPETFSRELQENSRGVPEIDFSKCTGCGKCVLACPTQALKMTDCPEEDRRSFLLSRGSCIFCGLCESACPHQAIAFSGACNLAASTKAELNKKATFPLSVCRKDAAFVAGAAHPGQEKTGEAPDFSRGAFFDRLTVEESGLKLKNKIQSLFGRSLHIREVDAGSCNGCEVEVSNLSNPIYDVERFGIHFVASPRHADMILVTGPVTRAMELALVKTYEAMPSPRLVVACGTCAISGGIFQDSYSVTGGVDHAVPVDLYIPGCPPHPLAIIHGILTLLDKVPHDKK